MKAHNSLIYSALRAFFVPPLGIEPGPSEPESEILSFKLQGHPVRDCKFSKNYGFASILFPFSQSRSRLPYLAAMHSISTRAPFGRVLTATALRAGKGEVKNWE